VKSLLHNIGVVAVGFGVAYLGAALDSLFDFIAFKSRVAIAASWLLLAGGFLLRVWATAQFYKQHMNVISLVPQKKLITSGAYRFSRNPLYLGGNVFIFLGASLFLGSPMGIVLTAINILVLDFWIRREERQLEREFGTEWLRYKNEVRRWL
jgi:protein-S-isoprenylcysteine O-methyltransferase Ste14